jgi:hypothetical protein
MMAISAAAITGFMGRAQKLRISWMHHNPTGKSIYMSGYLRTPV